MIGEESSTYLNYPFLLNAYIQTCPVFVHELGLEHVYASLTELQKTTQTFTFDSYI